MATGLEIKQKRQMHSLRWILVLLLIAAAGLMFYWGYRWYTTGEEPPIPIPVASADPSVDESPVTPQQVAEYSVPPTHPRYITIPALGITKSRIMSVGVADDGMLDTPKNINDVAWYTKSVTPGQGSGAVLINGHNGGITRNGVFANLNTLAMGETITIERGDGKKFNYKVVYNQSMTLDEANKSGMKNMMYSAEPDKEGLNLITCDGKWIPKDKVFDRRIMLRAVLADS